MKSKQQTAKKFIWIEIKHGDDLLKTISDFCLENNIKNGLIFAIGALQKAEIGYYHQQDKTFGENLINEPTEIVSCLGNVSLKEGKPFVHAHISVADKRGNVLGGHLNPGCVVFACECLIIHLEGGQLTRNLDERTGLSLWDFS